VTGQAGGGAAGVGADVACRWGGRMGLAWVCGARRKRYGAGWALGGGRVAGAALGRCSARYADISTYGSYALDAVVMGELCACRSALGAYLEVGMLS
jgi:hypothetical protein